MSTYAKRFKTETAIKIRKTIKSGIKIKSRIMNASEKPGGTFLNEA
jgi:hypothetical protein